MAGVIVRMFRGRVRPGLQEAFQRYLRERAVPEIRAQPGLLSVHVGFPTEASPDEFLVVSVWRDLPSLRAVVGERWTGPMVSPDEARMLRGAFVHHYEMRDGDVPLGEPTSRNWADAVEAGPLRLDLGRRVARVEGRDIELPPKEFAVLVELAVHPDKPIPSRELALRVWTDGNVATAEDVRRTVYRLRRLLGDHLRARPLIRNRRGHGYLLAATPD